MQNQLDDPELEILWESFQNRLSLINDSQSCNDNNALVQSILSYAKAKDCKNFGWLIQSLQDTSKTLEKTLVLIELFITKTCLQKTNQRQHCRLIVSSLSALIAKLIEASEISEDNRERIRKLLPYLTCKGYKSLYSIIVGKFPHALDTVCMHMRKMLATSMVYDAVQLIVSFGIQDNFSYDEVINPLIEAQYFNDAIAFVRGSTPNHMARLVRHITFKAKNVKLGFKLVLKEELDIHEFQDVEAAAKFCSVNFFIKQGKIDDFAEIICGDNVILQNKLVNLLLRKNQYHSFKFCAKLFNLHTSKRFRYAYNSVQCVSSKKTNNTDFVLRDESSLLPSSVPVIFVNNERTFQIAKNRLLAADVNVIGLDSEFMPSFCRQKNTNVKAVLLQVACFDACFLFDIIHPFFTECTEFFASLFSNEKIIKLGYDFSNDHEALRNAMAPDCSCFNTVTPVLDLRSVAAQALFENIADVPKGGLSALCSTVLHQPLDKTEQVSNWAQRPLRASQIIYAATDAFCLVKIYERIVEERLLVRSRLAHHHQSKDQSVLSEASLLATMQTKLNFERSA